MFLLKLQAYVIGNYIIGNFLSFNLLSEHRALDLFLYTTEVRNQILSNFKFLVSKDAFSNFIFKYSIDSETNCDLNWEKCINEWKCKINEKCTFYDVSCYFNSIGCWMLTSWRKHFSIFLNNWRRSAFWIFNLIV